MSRHRAIAGIVRSRALGVAACLTLAMLLHIASPGVAVRISWKAVEDYGRAIDLFRNSHCTATAALAKYHGLQRNEETDRAFVATTCIYTEDCQCGKPGRPTLWRVAQGLRKLLSARGAADATVKERYRYAAAARNRADFTDYVRAINNNEPVLLTYCYDPAARSDLATARGRARDAFSVVGIGYMRYGDEKLLICHDGVVSPRQAGPVAVDRVSVDELGIATRGKPWGRSGTTLYKWDGRYKNLVMVFVDK